MPEPLPTIAEAARRIRAGELTPLDLVERCLARIRERDGEVRAWVHVDEEGARRVAEEQTRLARAGEARGALFGIPIGIKDIIDVAAMKTRCGSPLLENNVAAEDAPCVAALRREGAIILGKTATTQFACFDPAPTRNPSNLAHTPGGSSSGSAAAVADGMCLAALGTQTGGSILRPAAYCGVAGLKPTFGAVSTQGVHPVSVHLDHVGPIARSVDDLALLFTVLRPGGVLAPPPAPPTLLVPGELVSQCTDEIQSAFRETLTKFQAVGATIRDVELGLPLAEILAAHRAIMAVDAAKVLWPHYQANKSSFAPNLAGLLEEGHATPPERYTNAFPLQANLRNRVSALLQDADLLALPTTPAPAAPLTDNTTGDPRLLSPFSFTGHPAITIPAGLTADLPWGLQLVGRLGGDIELITVARWCDARA